MHCHRNLVNRAHPLPSSQADVISRPGDVTGISLVCREAGPKFLLTRPASGGFGLAVETGRGGMTDGGMALNQRNGATMTNLRTLSAAVALAAMLPLAVPTASLATYRGPGPCTPPAGAAVGAAGPAMSGGQLMAGVGQCQRIGSWHPHYGGGAYAMGPLASDPYAASDPYYGAPDY